MHILSHWGDEMNWKPIVWFGIAAAIVFLARMITVWFYIRRLRETVGDDFDEDDDEALSKAKELFSSQRPLVPVAVSSLYFLSGVAFIGTGLWGTLSTAWWVVILAILVWVIIHWPFREVMLSWSRTQNVWMIKQDTDALLKGDLSPEQARAIKKRLGLDR
jgi:hypothetical protein